MKKQKTFADRAKAIKAKYTRAEWDQLEKKDMMKELAALREEQEQMRAAMGIADHADKVDEQEQSGAPEEEMRYGGGMYDGYNDSQFLKKSYMGNFELPYKNVPQVPTYSANAMSDGPLRNPQPRSNFVPTDMNTSGIQPPLVGQGYGQWNPGNQMAGLAPKPSMPPEQNQYQPISSSVLPFAISAGASAIGDIASMISARKNMPKSVNLPRMRAEQINLQPQREALQRGYNTASNIMLRNARDVSSPGNAYANQIAGQSQLMDSYGTQMGQSYMNEANTNAQMRQQTGLQNQQVGVQEALQNVQLKQQNAQIRNQFINSLSQTIPNALRDYRQQINNDNMVNTMGLDYGLYEQVNPNMTFMEKLQRGLLGGHNNTILSRRDQRIRQ